MARPRTEPNPENASLQSLKETARVGSSETALRCTAIQMLITSLSREQVCAALLVTERALLKWIHAFNASGIDGLIVKNRTGRPRKIEKEQEASFVDLFEHPEQADRTHWTVKSFHGYLQKEFQLECSYSTVIRLVHENNFALKVPQPWSNRQDKILRQAFKERLKALHEQANIDSWFGDESGFEGECRARRRWDRKGRKTRIVRNGDHTRMNVIGAVCPRTGAFFALEVSHVDTVVFQVFLDESARWIQPKRKRNLLILDNATWHKSKSLNWHFFKPMYLPPYSPDLNPIERLWLVMKAKWFNHFHAKDQEALMERLDHAILDLIQNPQAVQKTTSIRTLF